MNINWKVRFKNKWFWLTAIPLIILLIQQIAAIFGWQLDLNNLQDQLVGVVDTGFAILALLGIAVDMTTAGLSDSARALSYESPYESAYNSQGVVVKELQAKEEMEEALDAQAEKEA